MSEQKRGGTRQRHADMTLLVKWGQDVCHQMSLETQTPEQEETLELVHGAGIKSQVAR